MVQDKRIREYKVGEQSTIEIEMRVRESDSELSIIVRRQCQGKGKESWQAEEQGVLLYFLELLCLVFGILEDKGSEGLSVSAKGCLCRLGVKVIGHRDGS